MLGGKCKKIYILNKKNVEESVGKTNVLATNEIV